jgi:hypothetical protein
MKRIISSMVGLCVLAGAAGVQAQSLADIARTEQARRKTVKRPTKVYTNADVVVIQPATPATSEVTKETSGDGTLIAPGDAAAQGGAAGAADSGPKPGVVSGDEAKWRSRYTDAREQISRSQIQLEAMRVRVTQLNAAKAYGPDGQQSASLQTRQREALQEFDKLRADVERNQKAFADLEAEAKAAGVPPGWVR